MTLHTCTEYVSCVTCEDEIYGKNRSAQRDGTSIVDRDREKSASVEIFRVTYSICVGMVEQYKLKISLCMVE